MDAFYIVIALAAGYIAQRFVLPVIWAAVLATAMWPLFVWLLRCVGGRKTIAALLLTLTVALVFITPVALVMAEAMQHAPEAAAFISEANRTGITAPSFLTRLPLGSALVEQWWETTLAQPHGLAHLFSGLPLARFSSVGELLKTMGARFAHSMINFGFSIVCRFFLFINGPVLARQVDYIGGKYVGAERWQRYVITLPLAIKSTVNGLVLVGLGEGVLLGVSYAVTGLSSPVLWAAATAILAIIPFGAPIVFLAAAGLLAASGSTSGAIGVVIWGTFVLMLADHLIRPRIIGGATKTPFLLVLFGILGGIESFGLIGLFVGPCIMSLLISLWRDSTSVTESLTAPTAMAPFTKIR